MSTSSQGKPAGAEVRNSKRRALGEGSAAATTDAHADQPTPEGGSPPAGQSSPASQPLPSPSSSSQGALPSPVPSEDPDATVTTAERTAQQYAAMFTTAGIGEFQLLSMQQMGLGCKGPTDTAGDGECMFRAFSQQQACHDRNRGTAWAMDNSEAAQQAFGPARTAAAAEFETNPELRASVVKYAAHILDRACLPNGPILRKALGRHDASQLPDIMAAKVRLPAAQGEQH